MHFDEIHIKITETEMKKLTDKCKCMENYHPCVTGRESVHLFISLSSSPVAKCKYHYSLPLKQKHTFSWLTSSYFQELKYALYISVPVLLYNLIYVPKYKLNIWTHLPWQIFVFINISNQHSADKI